MSYINGRNVHFVSDLPELLEMWDFEKNEGVDPSTVPVRSMIKRWFRCPKCKHSQFTSPNTKTLHQTVGGCRACNGQTVCNYDQSNSFGKVYPDLVQYWDCERNADTPYDVTSGSGSKRWFKCKTCGHVHQKQVYLFPILEGCAKCVGHLRTSFGECAIAYYLRKCGIDVIRNDTKILDGLELDIVIPEMKIAIEYDGAHWHKLNVEKNIRKYEMCKKLGFKLYRVCECQRENEIDESAWCDWCTYFISKVNRRLYNKPLIELFRQLGLNCDIDIIRDLHDINDPRLMHRVKNSVAGNERMERLWNYERNHVDPKSVSVNCSSEKYWFKCPRCGGDWYMTPAHVNNRNGCINCNSSIQGMSIAECDPKTLQVIKVWPSLRAADKHYGLKNGSIRRAVKGTMGYGMGHVYLGKYWKSCEGDAK